MVAGAVLVLLTASALAADDLIVFDRSRIETLQNSVDIRVIAKLDNLAAAFNIPALPWMI